MGYSYMKLKSKSTAHHALALLGLAAITLWVFHFLFSAAPDSVISFKYLDLDTEYYPWRVFASEALRNGHIPLWNPFLYFGSPFFANPETALLYPLNWIHLFLPVATAINLIVAVHIFLAGANFYFWMAFRRIQPFAAVVAATCFMLSGPVFCHVWAGHLSNLASMAWAPLVFLSLDGLFTERPWHFCLLGMAAVALQILAGHTQYLFFTSLIASFYFLLKFSTEKKQRRPVFAFIIIYVGAVALTAIQLLTTADSVTTEAVRSSGMDFQSASIFSLAPEGIIDLLVPGFFGNMKVFPYWGRNFFWEMCVFFSITGFIFAIYGACVAEVKTRWLGCLTIYLCVILALGKHTPLYYWCYKVIPMFDHFRGPSKFIFQASLFFCSFIAIGFDDFLKRDLFRRHMAVACYFLAALLFGLAGWVQYDEEGWHSLIYWVFKSSEVLIDAVRSHSQKLVTQSQTFAFYETQAAAFVLLGLGTLLWFSNRRQWIKYGIGLLAITEVIIFAGQANETFQPLSKDDLNVATQMKSYSPDERILWSGDNNSPMKMGFLGTWGYSSLEPLRIYYYSLYMARDKGLPLSIERIHSTAEPYLNLTRTRLVVGPQEYGLSKLMVNDHPFSRFLFMHEWEPASDMQAAVARVSDVGFDPRRTVVLESTPQILPDPHGGDSPAVHVQNENSDSMDIDFDLSAPTILMMTDAYAKDWHAHGLAGSIQDEYQVMPADGVVRAIPVKAGHHHFTLEYLPRAFETGKWISFFTLVFIPTAFYFGRRRKEVTH
jgi:hypothetical protein